MTEDLRYPIGKFHWPATVSPSDRDRYIDEIASAPSLLRAAVEGLSAEQLATPYRPGGWTVTQVVHHLPDSHINSYVRFRLALTESEPTITPYDEAAWAQLADVAAQVETSLQLLECLHERWVMVLRSLTEDQWKRRFIHPALGPVTLENNLALYAWHGAHHIGHVTELRRREGW